MLAQCSRSPIMIVASSIHFVLSKSCHCFYFVGRRDHACLADHTFGGFDASQIMTIPIIRDE